MDPKISKLNSLFNKTSTANKTCLDSLKVLISDLIDCDKLSGLDYKNTYSDDLLNLTKELINQYNENHNTINCMMNLIGELEEKYDEVNKEQNLNFDINEQIYEDKFKDQLETMRQNQLYSFENDVRYLEILKLLQITNDNELEIDEDFEKIPIDPFTQQEIQDAVRNKICKHIYDKVSISNYINQYNKPKCPKIGCGNRKILSFNDITEDKDLNEKIERLKNSL